MVLRFSQFEMYSFYGLVYIFQYKDISNITLLIFLNNVKLYTI